MSHSHEHSHEHSPPDDMSEEIKHAWAHGAHEYDRDPGHGLLTPKVEAAWKAVLTESLGSEARDVLDVGTGTGFLALIAASMGHRVTGADLTPAMLDQARARAEQAGARIEWHEAEATALPFDDARFDAVISRHVLWTMPDPGAAFREWIRVTRSGGSVLWFDSLQPRSVIEVSLRRWTAAALRRVQRRPDHAGSHHYSAALYGRLPLRNISSVAAVEAQLRAVGVEEATFRMLPELRRVERGEQPLYKRISHAERRYVGSFRVSDALRVAALGDEAS